MTRTGTVSYLAARFHIRYTEVSGCPVLYLVGGSQLLVDGSQLLVDGSQRLVDGSQLLVDGSQLLGAFAKLRKATSSFVSIRFK